MENSVSFFGQFAESARELKKLRCLTVTGLLIALNIVLKAVGTVQLAPDLRVTFDFLALAAIGMLFGPTVAGLAGGITDILGFLVDRSGQGFYPGFTLVEMLTACAYGVALYHTAYGKRMIGSLTWRSIVVNIFIAVICHLFLNTFLISLTMGKGFWAMLPPRIIKNLVMIPVKTVLMVPVLSSIRTAYARLIRHGGRGAV